MPRILTTALIASSLLLARPAPASACGGSDRWNPVHAKLDAAARLLAGDRHREAVALVRRDVAGVLESSGPVGDTDPWVHDRARQLIALAVARGAGALALAPGLGGKRPEQRRAAIVWAITVLRGGLTHSSGEVACRAGGCRSVDDPAYTGALAEALARAEDSRDEAFRLLKELSDDDLVPTAQAWAVLAALHRQRGELDAGEAAARRCRETAVKGVRCDVAL